MSENTSPSTASAESSAEFKNEHVTVKVEKLPGCIAKFNISVSPVASQAAYAKAIKNVAKEVSVPGFRKGKAPAEVIKKNYAKFIDKEWEDSLLRTSFAEALALAKLDIYRNEGVKNARFIKKFKDAQSEIFVEFEHAPEIPSINANEIYLKAVEPAPVTDEEVDDELKAMQLNIATWEPNPEKIVEEGDYVDLDIVAVDNPTEMLCEDMRFLVSKDQMSPWMHQILIGLKTGESKEGVNDQVQGQEGALVNDEEKQAPLPAKFKLTLKGIFVPILPELSDDFAKKYQAEGIEDLKQKIRAGLIRQSEANAKTALRNQVIEQLLEKYPFDIPTREYTAEKKLQLDRLHNKVQGPELSQLEKLRLLQEAETYTKNLPNNYRLFFLAKRFGQEHNIQVMQQELYDAVLEQLMASRTSPNSLIDEAMDPNLMHSIVYNHLILEKAVDFIVKQAQFV